MFFADYQRYTAYKHDRHDSPSPCTSNLKGFCKSRFGQYEIFFLHPSLIINKHRLQLTSHSLSPRDVERDSTILIDVANEMNSEIQFFLNTTHQACF